MFWKVGIEFNNLRLVFLVNLKNSPDSGDFFLLEEENVVDEIC